MRILFVGRNAQIGGGSTFRLNIGRGLIERGHEVSVAALGGAMVQRYRQAGIGFRWAPPWSSFVGRMERVMREFGPDIVHASNTTAGDVALAACERLGIPLVLSLHNTISDAESQHRCLKQAARVIVFDAGAAVSASKFSERFDTRKVIRLPRPVPHEPVDRDRISPLRLAYVGRLSSRKGKVCLSLLEGIGLAAKTTSGLHLIVLGDGSMEREVKAEARRISERAGCRIEVLGRVVDPGPVLEGVGIVIGAGYAALEAVMQGRAVIGAGFKGFGPVTEANVKPAIDCNFGDTVGTWEMSPENFAVAIGEHLGRWADPARRDEAWGLDRVVAPIHSVPEVAARLEAVYREVVGGE